MIRRCSRSAQLSWLSLTCPQQEQVWSRCGSPQGALFTAIHMWLCKYSPGEWNLSARAALHHNNTFSSGANVEAYITPEPPAAPGNAASIGALQRASTHPPPPPVNAGLHRLRGGGRFRESACWPRVGNSFLKGAI